MGKHRRQNLTTIRRVATASALAVGASTLAVAPADAVELPATAAGSSQVDIEGLQKQGVAALQNLPGIESVPGAQEFIAQQAANTNYGNPAPAAAPAAQTAVAEAAPASNTGQAIVDAARSKIGSPYGWGATGPSSFDCSGLTSWAYQQVGKAIPRTSQAQAAQGTQVSQSEMQPGDIIAYYGGASHVAIYAGNGMMIDALNSGSTVTERPVNYMPIHSVFRF